MESSKISKDRIVICSVVFAVCLFFMAAFRVQTPDSVTDTEQNNSGLLYMMPRDSGNEHPYFKEQEARDKLDDPTIMSFPNLKHGFSSVRKNEGEPPPPELPVYNLKTPGQESLEISREPLVGEFKVPNSNPAHSLVKPDIEPISTIAAKGRFSKRIVWMEDGKEKLSPYKIDEILKITGDELPPERTELQIVKIEQSHAFFLKQKSGNEKLDKLVLDYFRKLSLSRFLNEKGAKELPGKVIVDWRLLR